MGGEAGSVASPDTSLLVYSVHKSPFVRALLEKKPFESGSTWNKKQRRLYHRILSGFEFARKNNNFVRVMCLTSSEGSPANINHSFEVLRKRIRRKYGLFEYSAVKEQTKTSLLHLHIVYRGSFISQKWLSEAWNDIHSAKIVWIAKLYSWKFAKHLARYFIKEGIGRFWASHSWVYRGFVRDWKKIVSVHQNRAVAYWKAWLWNWEPPKNFDQKTLYSVLHSSINYGIKSNCNTWSANNTNSKSSVRI